MSFHIYIIYIWNKLGLPTGISINIDGEVTNFAITLSIQIRIYAASGKISGDFYMAHINCQGKINDLPVGPDRDEWRLFRDTNGVHR